jgi:hypothetical protein
MIRIALAALLALTPIDDRVRLDSRQVVHSDRAGGDRTSGDDPRLLSKFDAAHGTTLVKGGSPSPTFTRSTAASYATCSGGVVTLATASTNAPRFETLCDGRVGYLPERAGANTAIQSDNFALSWTATRASVVTNTGQDFFGGATADTLHEDSTAANTHWVGGSASVTSATVYTFSVGARALQRSWVRLRLGDGFAASTFAYFNLGTCAVGTVSNATARLSTIRNKCRVEVTATANATTTGTYFIEVAEADGDVTFDGLNQDSIELAGAQFEAGGRASSYRPTTTTSVTRGADILTYSSTGNLSEAQGSVVCRVQVPNGATTAGVFINLYSAVGNRWQLFESALDVVQFFGTASAATQATINSTSGISDGTTHTIAGTWATNDARLYIDGVQHGSTDTSVTPPTGLTSITLGHVLDDFQPGSLIFACCIYDERRTDCL